MSDSTKPQDPQVITLIANDGQATATTITVEGDKAVFGPGAVDVLMDMAKFACPPPGASRRTRAYYRSRR